MKIKKGIIAGVLTLAMALSTGVTTFAASSASQTVNLGFTVDPTTTLAVSTNSISFGNVNPLTSTYTQSLTATVQSNATYKLTAVAGSDFKTADTTPKIIAIDHLGVKLHSDSTYKTMSKDSANPVVLASSQPATASSAYPIDLQLNTDWNSAVPGSYTTTVQFAVTQS
ncbi:hypothetical protein IAI10_16395 [Clostridium sp. 19966]|uniref:hypothetical protein n=1 Tax=Clostridium sp. 19966 TaxID=2768166 RepID=UPI0028E0207F|nr:hypothetical protein [Clostridium sp. 19966]MDT8718248.1 hypothetical protein [Clostridium sp. 19966]